MSAAERLPDNFRIVRYEDLVTKPEGGMRRLCEFAKIDFADEMLDIPHVNPSESQYALGGPVTGMRDSRVFYYRHVLTLGEEATATMWTDRRLLRRLYPELLLLRSRELICQLPSSIALFCVGTPIIARSQLEKLLQSPMATVDRVSRRVACWVRR